MPRIRVTSGGPEIDPGTYPVTLVEVEGPKTIVPQTGPNAGQEVDIFVWKFAVDEGDYDGTEIEATSSTNSGPKSKLYGFLAALLSKAPAIDAEFELAELAGRRALATIEADPKSGWMRITGLTAMPAAMLSRGVAAATGAALRDGDRQRAQTPVQTMRGRTPLRQQVENNDGAPF